MSRKGKGFRGATASPFVPPKGCKKGKTDQDGNHYDGNHDTSLGEFALANVRENEALKRIKGLTFSNAWTGELEKFTECMSGMAEKLKGEWLTGNWGTMIKDNNLNEQMIKIALVQEIGVDDIVVEAIENGRKDSTNIRALVKVGKQQHACSIEISNLEIADRRSKNPSEPELTIINKLLDTLIADMYEEYGDDFDRVIRASKMEIRLTATREYGVAITDPRGIVGVTTA